MSGAVTTRAYRGSLTKATRNFQRDAEVMAKSGWVPTSQSYAPGSWGCGYFLIALLLCFVLVGFLIFIYMIIVKPEGTLTVTYQQQEVGGPTKVCPRCAETIKRAASVCRFCGYEFVWAPTHRVPDGGMPAWDAADPSLPPAWTLNGGLGMIVVERLDDWAFVEASNGWRGWVDFSKLLSYDTPSSISDETTSNRAGEPDPGDATSSESESSDA